MVSYNKKDEFLHKRQAMIADQIVARGISDTAILKALEQVAREQFVGLNYQDYAYTDGPLPIGMGQTISQPYIVALMTQWLNIKPDNEILEIGTGSGYQTAILAKLCKKVYTVERFSQLQETAQAALGRCDINNVEYYIGDGSKGWHEKRQFDGIIVTAAAEEIPDTLVQQLKVGGAIVMPVGGQNSQKLVCGIKQDDEKLTISNICAVRFVRLIGEYGYKDE